MLVSACLLGERVRYDGRAAPWEPPEIWHRWRAEGRLLAFCAECAAGFPVPRPSAERVGERVLESCGVNVIYDGSFTGQKRSGEGIVASFLRQHGLQVFSEQQLEQVSAVLARREG